MPRHDKQNKRAQPPQNGAPFRSLKIKRKQRSFFEGNVVRHSNKENPKVDAGWSSPVARQAHNLKVTGSNPVPATKYKTQNKTPRE